MEYLGLGLAIYLAMTIWIGTLNCHPGAHSKAVLENHRGGHPRSCARHALDTHREAGSVEGH